MAWTISVSWIDEIEVRLNACQVPLSRGKHAFLKWPSPPSEHSPGMTGLEILAAGQRLLFVADGIVLPLHL
jgi:hypothetical protein